MPTRSSFRVGSFSNLSVALVCVCAVIAADGCARQHETEQLAVSIVATSGGNPSPSLPAARHIWPGWRGGAVGGVAATAERLPTQWSTTAGIRWATPIQGEGNSSPVVWDDRIFLTTARPVDDRVRLEVLCLDRATGRVLWINEAGFARGPTHGKNGYASATPATDGQRVFVSFGNAGLFCFDIAGRQVWHESLHNDQHEWGAATSPLLFGGQVIQVCDQGEDSFIAAFDAASGAARWRTPRASGGGWSTPVIAQAFSGGGVRHELIVNGSGAGAGQGGGWIVAYDPGTGGEVWRVRGTSDVVCPTPVLAGDLVLSSSGRNGPVIAIRTGGSGDVTSSHVVWKHGRGGPYVPSGVAVGNRLYLIRDEGALDCYDVASGKRLWQERLRGSFTASLVAGDGKLYATSEQGRVDVIAVDEKFKLLATNRLEDRCLATPAIAGGDLFVRTQSRLYCIAAPQNLEVVTESSSSAEPRSASQPTSDSPAISTRTIPAKSSTSTIYGSPSVRKKERRKRTGP
jgi:outer membrane protein assembly factor BamB